MPSPCTAAAPTMVAGHPVYKARHSTEVCVLLIYKQRISLRTTKKDNYDSNENEGRRYEG